MLEYILGVIVGALIAWFCTRVYYQSKINCLEKANSDLHTELYEKGKQNY
jgi:hypothetical protein